LVAVIADGHALNGNESQAQAQIDVARVLWTRTLPTQYYGGGLDGPTLPLAVDSGIYVPLLDARQPVPVFFRASDGQPSLYPDDFLTDFRFMGALSSGESTFASFLTLPVDFTPDGGYSLGASTPIKPDASVSDAGYPVFVDGGVVTFAGGTPDASYLGSVTEAGLPGVLRVDPLFQQSGPNYHWSEGQYVCEDDITNFLCSTTAPRSIRCMGISGDVVIDGGVEPYDNGTPLMVQSGSTLAFLNVGDSCLGGQNFPLKLAPLTSPQTGFVNWPGVPAGAAAALLKVLSEGNDSFFGVFLAGNNAEVLEFNLTSGSTFTPSLLPAIDGRGVGYTELLAARPDRSIVAYSQNALTTSFGLWFPAKGLTLAAETSLPLTYEPVDFATTTATTPYAKVASDLSTYVLMRRSNVALGGAQIDIIKLGADLKPQWIYHYPRGDQQNDGSFRIALSPASDQLYLIDGDNGLVTALAP
jgi:hypothetical protein